MEFWAESTFLRVSRGVTSLVSAVLVAGSMGALVSLAPPAVAAPAAAAAGLGAATTGDVRIRHHRDTRTVKSPNAVWGL